jgi:nucleotide-binding universal stress UspA family protein
MFSHIAVTIDFSPYMEGTLAEGRRLSQLYGAALSVIHIGEDDLQQKKRLQKALRNTGINPQEVQLFWQTGEPVEEIMTIARDQKIDLLVAAANEKKNLVEYYTGSVARNMIRQAPCSVLLCVRQGEQTPGYRKIIVKAGEMEESKKSMPAACLLAQQEKAEILHIVKQVNMYGFTMAVASQDPAEEYQETKEKLYEDEIKEVEQVLEESPVEDLPIDIKVVKEKYGPALVRISQETAADLLIMAAPEREPGFMEKVVPTDLEYLLKDLPCNLMLVQAD